MYSINKLYCTIILYYCILQDLDCFILLQCMYEYISVRTTVQYVNLCFINK